MNLKYRYINLALASILLSGCGSHDDVLSPADDEALTIHVGSVTTADMTTAVTTRAEASTVPGWLNEGLNTDGMNMVYDLGESEQFALLKYDKRSYSMNLYGTDGKVSDTPAKWLGNGAHVFRGAYVPVNLRNEGTTKAYDDLWQYTSKKKKKEIYATIDKITIPTQHRLARVVAYVLIDDKIKNVNGTKTKLKGYATDPKDAKLRFCNVEVLDYVDTDGRPHWTTATKVTPHYLNHEDITIYQETGTNNFVFPTDDNYKEASENSSKYTAVSYGDSPYYDIIVRPTYTKTSNKAMVMGDELPANDTDTCSNKIDFELTLENDLEYEKTFKFDLNANDETVVYLRVSPEKIDYNSTGSRLWNLNTYHDKYYGVDNPDHELSMAGSSWQRAYTYRDYNATVADGKEYKYQYISDGAEFIAKLKQATEMGDCKGKYFVLLKDITISLADFPTALVGHLDGMGHTIIVVPDGTRNWLYSSLNAGWNSEIFNVTITGGVLFETQPTNAHVKNCWNDGSSVGDVTPDLVPYKN